MHKPYELPGTDLLRHALGFGQAPAHGHAPTKPKPPDPTGPAKGVADGAKPIRSSKPRVRGLESTTPSRFPKP
jgi:hypothetical protein